MRFEHRADWEWGWKTPLLLRFSAPDAVSRFLALPSDKIDLSAAELDLSESVARLKTTRIGVRFERIQSALFRAHPDTESLRTSLVLPGRTEIDLLHRLRTLPNTVLHWEVAVKFYLGLDAGGSADADRFIGPSLRDTLGKKLRAIFGRQLAALSLPEVREHFATEFGILPSDRILALPKVHGILFHPFRTETETACPLEVSPSSLRGAWFEIGEFSDFLASREKEWGDSELAWLVDRRDWIRDSTLRDPSPEWETPFNQCLNSSLFGLIQSHFSGGGEPIQGALVRRTSNSPGEFRFFIVPNGWHSAAERELETLRAGGRI